VKANVDFVNILRYNDNMEKYGLIYMITNNINNKKYIGVTTKTLEERFNGHINRANKERSAIQKAIHKYGKDNFTIIEIDTAVSEEDLFNKERMYIKKYNTYLGLGYNLTEGGGGIVNMSEEIRQKISKTKTGAVIPKLHGRHISKEQRIKISRTLGAKKVECTNEKTGNVFYLDYPTQGKELGFNPSLICAVIKGKRPRHKNHIFKYIDDANTEETTESKNSVTP